MFKKKDKFAILLLKLSATVKEAAEFFSETKIENVSDLKVFSNTMKQHETAGDNIVHEIILELNNTFITPIDREDILSLTAAMDEVLDGLEHCAALREMYSIVHVDEYELKFVEEIVEAVEDIDEAFEKMVDKELSKITKLTISIKDHESTSDNIYRQAVKNLFSSEKDAIKIMKRKELYENLEDISDFCQNVAHVLDQIVMKNS